MDTKHMSAIEYFNLCKEYWLSAGCSDEEANYRTLWWDCKEVWDFDDMWNADRREFFREMSQRIPERNEDEVSVY